MRVQDRRGFVHRQFVREGWRADQAVLIFVLGTKTGERLESDIDTSSVRRLDGARYIFTPCRDMGDEWDNPNGTSATTCKVYEAYKVSIANLLTTLKLVPGHRELATDGPKSVRLGRFGCTAGVADLYQAAHRR